MTRRCKGERRMTWIDCKASTALRAVVWSELAEASADRDFRIPGRLLFVVQLTRSLLAPMPLRRMPTGPGRPSAIILFQTNCQYEIH